MTAKMKLFLQFATALAVVWIVTVQTPPSVRFGVTIPIFTVCLIWAGSIFRLR